MFVSMPGSRSTRWICAAATLLTLALLLAACGGGDNNDNESAADKGFGSAYCTTARGWAVHELSGGADGAYARGGSAGLKRWWNEQLARLKPSVTQPPAAIRDAESVNERAVRTVVTPLLAKYDFDPKRIDAEASKKEKAAAQPTASAARAQVARDQYRNRVCGYGGSPPPANVTFKASAKSKAYCAAAASQGTGIDKVVTSGFAPAAFKGYVTSDSFLKALDAEEATAPPEIAADVKADNAWVREHKLKVLKDHGYDLRRLLREGEAKELAAFTYWDPAVRTHDPRVEAYVQQVCGAR